MTKNFFDNKDYNTYTRYAIIYPPATIKRMVAISEVVWMTISLVKCPRMNSIVNETFFRTFDITPGACSSANS